MRTVMRLTRPTIADEEVRAVTAVLRSGALVQGAEVAAFEDELSASLDGLETVATSSGTTALHLALLAIGIKPGDEVVVPSFTFVATANAVRLAGAVPTFADVDESGCIDPASVAARITPRTAAVIAVHLYGRPADLDGLGAVCSSAGVALVEDACQAHGARYGERPVGSFGVASALSFYPSKNMTTGEGGAVLTADAAVAQRVRLLRNHGLDPEGQVTVVGTNARMTDVAAAIGRVQLARLPASLAARARLAGRYGSTLEGVGLPADAHPQRHAWNLYTVRVPTDRDGVADRMRGLGVEARPYYRLPVHRLQAHASDVELPVTDRLAAEVLSLPLHPGMDDDDVDVVAGALHESLP